MTDLLIAEHASQEPQGTNAETTFGGLPVAPAGAQPEWPSCASCEKPMQFLGRLLVPPESGPQPGQGGDLLLLLFLCMNDPGMCSSWEADGGSNRVLVVPARDLAPFQPPPGGVTLRETRYGASVVPVPEADYDRAREEWGARSGRRDVLGQLLGEPSWLQGEEWPDCDRCGRPMRFAAQLEEGPDAETAMNFGGGSAYVFDCACPGPGGEQARSAKLLWQC